jgi:hypothetical protein
MYFKVLELCMNFYLKHDFLMYFKIPYDFTILRSVFTIRVYFAFFVSCQNRDFNNLGSYVVNKAFSEGALKLARMDGGDLARPVNSDSVKRYYA